jgi:exodeoxyribonuclease VII small subunit
MKTYEELITELKGIVARIEEGEASLDESIALYEQGMTIIKQCEQLLNEAEVKITTLTRN